MAEGNEAPEEFPKVFFTVSDEDMASRKGPADRISSHDPVEVLRPLSNKYKEQVSWKRDEPRHGVWRTRIVSGLWSHPCSLTMWALHSYTS